MTNVARAWQMAEIALVDVLVKGHMFGQNLGLDGQPA